MVSKNVKQGDPPIHSSNRGDIKTDSESESSNRADYLNPCFANGGIDCSDQDQRWFEETGGSAESLNKLERHKIGFGFGIDKSGRSFSPDVLPVSHR